MVYDKDRLTDDNRKTVYTRKHLTTSHDRPESLINRGLEACEVFVRYLT